VSTVRSVRMCRPSEVPDVAEGDAAQAVGDGSTRVAVERALVTVFCVVRASFVVPSLYAVFLRSALTGASRGLALSLLVGIAVQSVFLGVWLRRLGSLAASRLPWVADVLLVVPCLVAVSVATPLEERQIPWSTGVFVVALSTAAFIALATPRFSVALMWGAGLALVYVLSEATPFLCPFPMVVTACTGALAFLMSSVVAWSFGRVTRDLAEAADDALHRAAVLERERGRATIHDLLPLLRPGAVGGDGSGGRPEPVGQDVGTVHQRMRAFVDGTDLPSPERAVSLRPVSTRADAEGMLAFGFVVCRGICVVMVLIGTVIISFVSPSPGPPVLTALAVVVMETAFLGRRLGRSGDVRAEPWLAWVDLLTGLTMLVVVMVCFPPGSRPSTWYLWVFNIPLSAVAFLAMTVRSVRRIVLIGLLMGLSHSGLFLVLAWNQRALIVAAGGDSWEYVGVAVSMWLFSTTIRRQASFADRARERVAQLERERNRARVHDVLPYLSPRPPTESDDAVRTVMERQARAKYLQLKAYVDGVSPSEDLGSQLCRTLELHPRLSPRTEFDFDPDLELPGEILDRLLRAVDTALANAEQNAPGAGVVLSASCTPDSVTVMVRDDGPGFDVGSTALGFGITRILGTHLEQVGGRGTVRSAPGRGTEVAIVVPRRLP
jgi:signal transduction histidine kinase